MRLTLIISHLYIGGAQRVLSILANYWAQKGWQITLLTLDKIKEDPFYDVHPAIIYRPLGIAGKSSNVIQRLTNNLKRIRVLRQAIKSSDPHIIISFMEQANVLVLFSVLKLNIPVFVCQHCDPDYLDQTRIWKYLRNLAYRGASRLIVLTQTAQAYFSPTIQRHTVVIPNPVLAQNSGNGVFSKKDKSKNEKALMAMGRLSEEKGFDILLRAFAKISQKHPEWSLVIWGEGPQRASLENLSEELGLRCKVRFPGITKQPYEKLKEGDLFILSSRSEAFPMVLLEAMTCGLPVISFDCPSGPREIIRDGFDGILVPPENVEALAAATDHMMGDDEERDRLAKRAPEVIERFGLEKVMGMWEEVLNSALEKQKI
jgi:GalNAc-alpha-(1->4)-GalNAc-alpha-(1->3)-diNAcBac-PP-undecaprenol alpha-1,4-N-acetyl-D-galactosaminyltransferase